MPAQVDCYEVHACVVQSCGLLVCAGVVVGVSVGDEHHRRGILGTVDRLLGVYQGCTYRGTGTDLILVDACHVRFAPTRGLVPDRYLADACDMGALPSKGVDLGVACRLG